MAKSDTTLDLEIDLETGVVPISKAASALAALIKRGRERQMPIIVTQKGYPTGVLLPIDLYSRLRELAQGQIETGAPALDDVPASVESAVNALPELVAPEEDLPDEPEAPAPPEPERKRGGRRRKAELVGA